MRGNGDKTTVTLDRDPLLLDALEHVGAHTSRSRSYGRLAATRPVEQREWRARLN
jgi:hypothetical protein